MEKGVLAPKHVKLSRVSRLPLHPASRAQKSFVQEGALQPVGGQQLEREVV